MRPSATCLARTFAIGCATAVGGAQAACSARAARLLRSFSTAFVQPAIFSAAALSLMSFCLLRSFSTALRQVLGAATRSFQSVSIDMGITERMSDRHFGASEHWSPCNVSASRTHIDLMFDDRRLHGVASEHVHQKHLIVNPAAQTLHHRTPCTGEDIHFV